MMNSVSGLQAKRAWGRFVSTVLCFQFCAFGLVEPAAAKKSAVAPVSHPHHTLTPYLVLDVVSGRIIEERIASHIWYPASVTKLMTVFVALEAVRQGRLTMDTPLVVTSRAAQMKPSKMGFPPGAQVTLDNALKMLMVKSANDIAVTVAEGVSGSVEAFADEMNQTAATLGMRESHFVNPNGLPDPNHVSSARDMAVLGRALLLRFPEHADLFNIGAFRLGDRIVPTHNGMIGRYPGADGMKTGFTCPAGFNLVASATRNGRKVIVVVMGDASARQRTARAADLFDRAFSSSQLGDFAANLPSVAGGPPDMKSEVCVRRSKAALLEAESEDLSVPINTPAGPVAAPQPGNGALIAALPRPAYEPISVFIGPVPGYQGPVAGPRPVNTPIGVIAYASPEKAMISAPLRPDPKALSMRRDAKPKHDIKSAAKSETKQATRKSVKAAPAKATKKVTQTKAHAVKPPGKAATN
jgi:D-alanyl-D-alanine carboxypeptidase